MGFGSDSEDKKPNLVSVRENLVVMRHPIRSSMIKI